MEVMNVQAAALQLPLVVLTVEAPHLEAYVSHLRAMRVTEGIKYLVTGDILDVAAGFMQRAADLAGVQLVTPLWQLERKLLLQSLHSAGDGSKNKKKNVNTNNNNNKKKIEKRQKAGRRQEGGKISLILARPSRTPPCHPGNSPAILARPSSTPPCHPGKSPAILARLSSKPPCHPGNSPAILARPSSTPPCHPGNSSAILARPSSTPPCHPGNSFAILARPSSTPPCHPGNSSAILARPSSTPPCHPGNSSAILARPSSTPPCHPGNSSAILARPSRSALPGGFSRGFSPIKLPDLPYEYGALEPYISGQIMYCYIYKQYHSSCKQYRSNYKQYCSNYKQYCSNYKQYRSNYKQYRSNYKQYRSYYEQYRSNYKKHCSVYVDNLNKLMNQTVEAEEKGDLAKVISLQGAIKFNGGGHINHAIFWTNLCPPKDFKPPSGDLLAAIEAKWKSLENFQSTFSAQTAGVQGSGWGWLVMKPDGSIDTVTMSNQDPVATLGLTPLLGIDVWEHAYYLQYLNVRNDYLKQIWNVVNWSNVEERFAVNKKYEEPEIMKLSLLRHPHVAHFRWPLI
eukprot:gene6807-30779_t